MMQNFAVFTDRSAATKFSILGWCLIWTIGGCGLAKMPVQIKTIKFSSEGLRDNFVKFTLTLV